MSKKKKGPGQPKKPEGEKYWYVSFRAHPNDIKKHGGKTKKESTAAARAVAKAAVEAEIKNNSN